MENKLKKYFLGTLSKAEIEAIDLQLISDENFEEDLILAKNDLMEDNLENALSADEIKSFETNFLNTDERVKELKNLALIKNYAVKSASENVVEKKQTDASESFSEKINGFFLMYLRPILIGFAAIFLAAVIFGVFYINSDDTKLAKLNGKDFTNVDDFRDLTNLNLISGTFRSTKGTLQLSAEKLTDPVFLRLALPQESEFFNVNVYRNDEKIVSGLKARSYSNENGNELRLLLPTSILTKGNYKLEAVPANSPSSPVAYSFVIQ